MCEVILQFECDTKTIYSFLKIVFIPPLILALAFIVAQPPRLLFFFLLAFY